MSITHELDWIKGRRIALCEPDEECYQQTAFHLKKFGLEVYPFNSVEAVIDEIEKRRYSTHRFYLVIMIDFHLAQQVEQTWKSVTGDNPTILETPVVLLRKDSELNQAQPLIDRGYFKFQLAQPVPEMALNRLMLLLNRWKRQQHDLANSAEPAAVLGREPRS